LQAGVLELYGLTLLLDLIYTLGGAFGASFEGVKAGAESAVLVQDSVTVTVGLSGGQGGG